MAEPAAQVKQKLEMSFFDRHLTVWVALCMAAGVLTEVPVMLHLVKIANRTAHWFGEGNPGSTRS